MKKVLDRILELKGSQNTAAFARSIGINQQTMDRYLKGREPPIGVVQQLCVSYGVSADWLLGLPEKASMTVTGNSGAVAIGHGARAKCTTQKAVSDRCEACKFKRFAEAFQALQKQ